MINSNLQKKLPEESTNPIRFTIWRKANGKTWKNELRQALIQHCNICHDWQFSEAQKTILEQYYNAN